MSSNSPFQAAEIVRARIPADFKPRVAMILGSGLGVLAEQMTDAVTISFNELPGFPISTCTATPANWWWVPWRACRWCA